MLDISIRQLEVFVATAEYCSFTKAAEDLHLTQSTVSMHIRTLEEVLGACLIERGARKKVILTEEGKRVYSMAKDILSRVDALQERRTDGGEELLRIGTSTVPAQYLLPKLLSGFLKKHSRVKYILRRGDSEHILECIQKGEVRIGLTGYRNGDRSLIFQEIARDHLVLITENSEAYRAMQAAGNTGKDLLDRPMIAREESSGTQHAADAFLQKLSADGQPGKYQDERGGGHRRVPHLRSGSLRRGQGGQAPGLPIFAPGRGAKTLRGLAQGRAVDLHGAAVRSIR